MSSTWIVQIFFKCNHGLWHRIPHTWLSDPVSLRTFLLTNTVGIRYQPQTRVIGTRISSARKCRGHGSQFRPRNSNENLCFVFVAAPVFEINDAFRTTNAPCRLPGYLLGVDEHCATSPSSTLTSLETWTTIPYIIRPDHQPAPYMWPDTTGGFPTISGQVPARRGHGCGQRPSSAPVHHHPKFMSAAHLSRNDYLRTGIPGDRYQKTLEISPSQPFIDIHLRRRFKRDPRANF